MNVSFIKSPHAMKVTWSDVLSLRYELIFGPTTLPLSSRLLPVICPACCGHHVTEERGGGVAHGQEITPLLQVSGKVKYEL